MLGRLERGYQQLSQVYVDKAHDLRTPIRNCCNARWRI
jgi:hypothetical protein